MVWQDSFKDSKLKTEPSKYEYAHHSRQSGYTGWWRWGCCCGVSCGSICTEGIVHMLDLFYKKLVVPNNACKLLQRGMHQNAEQQQQQQQQQQRKEEEKVVNMVRQVPVTRSTKLLKTDTPRLLCTFSAGEKVGRVHVPLHLQQCWST